MGFNRELELSEEIFLFFLLSTLDERTAIQSSQKVIAFLKTKHQTPRPDEDEIIRTQALQKSLEIWNVYAKQILGQRQKSVVNKNDKDSPAMNWSKQIQNLDPQIVAVWNRFTRQARPEEMIALLATRILKFSEKELSESLKVSIGTTRFRLARAAKQLGVCFESQP